MRWLYLLRQPEPEFIFVIQNGCVLIVNCLTGLTEGTEYTVEVEAVDTNNNVSAKAAVTFTTAKTPVTPEPTVVDKTELKATTAKADTALPVLVVPLLPDPLLFDPPLDEPLLDAPLLQDLV